MQAVNEFGGLSQKATAKLNTGIETMNERPSTSETEAIFTAEGKRISQMQHGLNIVRMSDGRVVKVMR